MCAFQASGGVMVVEASVPTPECTPGERGLCAMMHALAPRSWLISNAVTFGAVVAAR